jgi:hypothetical protein
MTYTLPIHTRAREIRVNQQLQRKLIPFIFLVCHRTLVFFAKDMSHDSTNIRETLADIFFGKIRIGEPPNRNDWDSAMKR